MTKIEKPWGAEELLEVNDTYVLKKLYMNKNARCSYQYHETKKETIFVLSGNLGIKIEDKILEYKSGRYITINPGVKHRMIGIEDSVYLEASSNQLDDVIRVEDDYDRL